ncbi:mechanosensitive ion channel family protein [Legionella sp. CNM-4043-24]|uniref:mechanosensitive ion channel family protein n=1 Tax=Legionella sp. CNM-4043-24 TaxID=3421646 RepID=UPI00403AEF14
MNLNLDLLSTAKLLKTASAFGLWAVGYILARQVRRLTERAMAHHFSRHHVVLVSRALFYMIFILFTISGLQHLGFNLSVLLGAAGVFTVAISFASQTAASNLISGVFLLFERPFKMGDNIEIKGINGTVESIDLLSTKIKTSDNKLVRVPNEALIKSEITNLSYFKTRRIDLLISVAYSCDIENIKDILLTVASKCPNVLPDPAPKVAVNRFVDSSIELKIMVWTLNEDFSSVKNQLQENIKEQFDLAGIELPSPLVTINRV